MSNPSLEVIQFLKSNGLKQVIRGHQCVSSGVEQFNNENLYTVFSASNYAPDVANLSGVLKLTSNGIEFFKFPPIRRLTSKEANYADFDASNYQSPLCHTAMRSFSKPYKIGGIMRPGSLSMSKKLISPSTGGGLYLKTIPIKSSKLNPNSSLINTN